MRWLYILAIAIVLALACSAQALYTYTGKDFTSVSGTVTTSDFIGVSLTFASALPANQTVAPVSPTAWTMSDGISTLSSSDGVSTLTAQIGTDAKGNIISWNISGSGSGVTMTTCLIGVLCGADGTIHTSGASVTGTGNTAIGNSGTWVSGPGTSPSPTPPTPGCSYSLSSNGLSFSAAGGYGSVGVVAPAGCPWTVAGAPAWIVFIGPISGSGSGSLNYQVLGNTGISARSVTMTIAGLPFTITEAAFPSQSTISSIPDLAAEGGWTTTFTLLNKGPNLAQANLAFYDDFGNPLVLPLVFPQSQTSETGASISQVLSATASLVAQATGPANVPSVEGSAILTANSGVDGFAIFHYAPTAQEAVVPLETRVAPAYTLAFDNTNGVSTGIALENVSAAPATIPVLIRNDAGAQVVSTTITLPAFGHVSCVLSQVPCYPVTANLRGTVEFDTPSGGQISVAGIRYTPPGTLTTIPSLANVVATGGELAQLAINGGWQTTFVLVNTSSGSATATLKLFDDNGNPLPIALSFPQTGTALTTPVSSYSQTVPPNASFWVQATGAAAAALQTGSAQLTATGDIGGYAIFRYNPNGQEAVVPLETRNASAYLIAFDNTSGTATGIAVSNASSQSIDIPVTVRDTTGATLAVGSLVLPANGHTSFVLASQFPQAAGIFGTVEFEAPSGGTISVLGIRTPPTLTFTTLPPLAE